MLIKFTSGLRSGGDEHFAIAGCGCYIRHLDKIVSWSLSDCYNGGQVAIGIQTARSYRKMGLAKQVVSAVVQQCWDKGYGSVEWLCVSTNRGSRAVAERVGFMLADTYPSFTSYAPIENFADLNDDGWYEWGLICSRLHRKSPGCIWNACTVTSRQMPWRRHKKSCGK